MKYFLGVDVGGTKTHALITDEAGLALGFGSGGPGNWQGVGFEGLRNVVKDVIGQALTSANLRMDQIHAAGFGIAGYDWPSQLQKHLDALEPIGLTCPMELTNDSIVGLLAGASQGWGVVVIAGTGNNCRGRDQHGREARITGEGIQFGEFGGASEIVLGATQAVAHEWTRRGPKTLLSKVLMELAGAKNLFDLIEGIDLHRYKPDAGWALAVFQAAYSGDPIARGIIESSGRELGESACGVIRQLGIENEEFEVVMAGSVFAGGDLYIDPLRETIHKTAPKAKFIRLETPPVVGSVVLAMKRAGDDPRPIRGNIIESTKKFVQDADFMGWER